MFKQLFNITTLLAFAVTPPAQAPDIPLHVGSDVKSPTVFWRVEPQFTDEARKAGVSGAVRLEGIVHKDGTISDVHVVQGLGFGLDEKALEAVTQWRFNPATKDGSPVDVYLNMEVTFHVLLRVGGDVKAPAVVKPVQAKFTEEAAKANVKGSVGLEFIVYYDGTAKVTKISKSLGYGLDESARTALEQTRFNPATKDGRPVDVLMEAEVAFPQPK